MSNTSIIFVDVDEIGAVNDFGSGDSEVSPETVNNEGTTAIIDLNCEIKGSKGNLMKR